jgi:hypothetical protein
MNLSQRLISLTVITAALSLSGCAAVLSGAMNSATTDDAVATKTAAYFGANPAQIKITDINKQLLATSYKANYKGMLYNCEIRYGSVSCSKPGEDFPR